MTDTPTNSPRKWSEASVVILTALTAFMTAYREFGAPDARQDEAISAIVDIVCLENERRAVLCQRKGLLK